MNQCFSVGIFFHLVLASLMSIWHKLESLGKRVPQLRKYHHGLAWEQAYGTFSWLMIGARGPLPYGQCHSRAGGPGCCKKAGCINYGEQVNSKPPPRLLLPASWFLSYLSFFPDLSQWWVITRIWISKLKHTLFSQVALVMTFIKTVETPRNWLHIYCCDRLALLFGEDWGKTLNLWNREIIEYSELR